MIVRTLGVVIVLAAVVLLAYLSGNDSATPSVTSLPGTYRLPEREGQLWPNQLLQLRSDGSFLQAEDEQSTSTAQGTWELSGNRLILRFQPDTPELASQKRALERMLNEEPGFLSPSSAQFVVEGDELVDDEGNVAWAKE